MKRFLILMLCITLLLSGCSWLDGEYHSVKLHASDGNKLSDDVVTVSDYIELRDALLEMVTSGRQQSTFYISGFDLSDAEQYMTAAIMHVKGDSAIGAYALDEITYESGNSGGNPAIAVEASYIHGRQEILRIKTVSDTKSVKNLLTSALRNCETSLVVKVKDYEKMDVQALVKEYAAENPHLCMEVPQVTFSTYPEQGSERVLEVFFTYQNSRETLKMMQDMVLPIFQAAEVYVRDSESEGLKYEQLYAFLMERFDYKIETSITPVYSLLRYGVGDSKAIAMVYNLMCQNANLSCKIVGGTKDGEAYYWNIIHFGNVDYHVDLLECSTAGEFTVMVPEEMTGYVWDYSDFE
jgi:hypothetical protein